MNTWITGEYWKLIFTTFPTVRLCYTRLVNLFNVNRGAFWAGFNLAIAQALLTPSYKYTVIYRPCDNLVRHSCLLGYFNFLKFVGIARKNPWGCFGCQSLSLWILIFHTAKGFALATNQNRSAGREKVLEDLFWTGEPKKDLATIWEGIFANLQNNSWWKVLGDKILDAHQWQKLTCKKTRKRFENCVTI